MVLSYLTDLAVQANVPIWLFVIILAWTATWKLLGLWKSARNGHIFWFVVIAIINTVGILPILYIYVFSKINWKKKSVKKIKRKVRKK